MFTSSTPYQEALAKIQNNEQIIELLREPIEVNGIMQGNGNDSNGNQEADLIPFFF